MFPATCSAVADGRRVRADRQVQQPLEPLAAFAQPTTQGPEAAKGGCHAQPDFWLAGFDGPGHGSTEVGKFTLPTIVDRLGVLPYRCGVQLLGQLAEVARVALPCRRRLTAGEQLRVGVLA